MTPFATTREDTVERQASVSGARRIRCAPVARHRALAVIRLGRRSEALEPALAGCLREIAGVIEVQIDSSRRTIQLLYDGELKTVEDVHRFLVSTGWGSTASEGNARQ